MTQSVPVGFGRAGLLDWPSSSPGQRRRRVVDAPVDVRLQVGRPATRADDLRVEVPRFFVDAELSEVAVVGHAVSVEVDLWRGQQLWPRRTCVSGLFLGLKHAPYCGYCCGHTQESLAGARSKNGDFMSVDNPYWPAVKWWLRDSASHTVKSAIGHNNCNHRNYLLTCAQYERLLQRADGKCEICGTRDVDNAHGKLYTDHVHRLGRWAVRGLLCRPCNSSLRDPWLRPAMRTYAGSAFYLTLLLEAGLDSITPAEPGPMIVVRDHTGRPWRREPEGWWLHWPDQNSDPMPHSWHRLIYRFGPHNLTTSEFPRNDVPLMGPIHNARIAAKYGHGILAA